MPTTNELSWDNEPLIELEDDQPPKSGEWVDVCDVLANPTDEELEHGQVLGESIDTDDDDDDGLTISSGSAGNDRPRAMKKALDLKRVMLSYGVPEVSIELRAGRPNSFGVWNAGFFVADMSHHTVSRYGNNKTPVLSLVKSGRSDLSGPLCNGYGGWDLCYRIITFGYANHPGAGGPFTVPALNSGRFQIPKDSARRYVWGTEFEGGLSESDWNRKITNPRNKKSMTYREFMGRSNAALEEYLEIANHAHLEHSTWTSRKIDRLGYSQAEGIAEKNRYRKVTVEKKNWIDISNLADQFKIAKKIEKGKFESLFAVKQVQRALNRVQGSGLHVDGMVGPATVREWEEFERRSPGGVEGRPAIPDEETVRRLLKKTVEYRR